MTGITSFVGSHTAKELIRQGCRVIGIIRPASRNKAVVENDPVLRNVTILPLDFDSMPDTDGGKEEFLVKSRQILEQLGKIDAWLHFSWDAGRTKSRTDVSLEEKNFNNARKAFWLAGAAGAKRFVFSGSQAEYGRGNHDSPAPVSEYGKAKLAFGDWAEKEAKDGPMQFIHLRIYSIYGQGDHPTTLITTLIKACLKNEEFSLGPCTQMWNFMEVRDAAAAIALVSLSPETKRVIYDIAGRENRRLKDYVLAVQELCGGGGKLEFGARGNNAEGAADLLPDISGLRELGFEEKFTFEDGIRNLREIDRKEMEDPEIAWKPVRVEHLVKDRWIDFRRVRYQLPDGREFSPYYNYSRRDYVVILARDEEGKFLCVRQYRHGIHKVTCEFPAGGIERGPAAEYTDGSLGGCESLTALAAAKRELLEETGYTSDSWQQLLIEPAEATLSDNYAYIYFADNCRKTGSQKLDDTEFLKVEHLSDKELDGLVKAGMFEQAVHVMAWLLYKTKA
jgi:UDP-glucose 4-epimerase